MAPASLKLIDVLKRMLKETANQLKGTEPQKRLPRPQKICGRGGKSHSQTRYALLGRNG